LIELSIEQALQKGVAAHKEGKVQEAEHLYRFILKTQPTHPDANHNLGILAVSFNKTDMVLPLFKTALDANPKIEQFWLSYIDALIKEKQFDNAEQVIQKAEKQRINRKKLNFLKRQLLVISQKENEKVSSPSQQQIRSLVEHYQNGRISHAEKLAMSITHEFPKHQFGWKVLGAVLEQTGRKSEALNANQKAVVLSPQDAEAHYNLGVTLKELGRLEEAESSYTQAIALKSNYVAARSNLGITLKKLGRLEEAEASYRQATAFWFAFKASDFLPVCSSTAPRTFQPN
jgi:Flp pilus assembly protein TadD